MAVSGAGGRKQVVGTRRTTQRRARMTSRRTTAKDTKVQSRMMGMRTEGVKKAVDDEVDRASRAIVEAYNNVMVGWYDNILKRWPVRTGFSRDQLQLTAEQIGDMLVMKLENIAGYAAYIRQRWHATPNVAKRLLWDPSRTRARRILYYIGDFISKGE